MTSGVGLNRILELAFSRALLSFTIAFSGVIKSSGAVVVTESKSSGGKLPFKFRGIGGRLWLKRVGTTCGADSATRGMGYSSSSVGIGPPIGNPVLMGYRTLSVGNSCTLSPVRFVRYPGGGVGNPVIAAFLDLVIYIYIYINK